MFFKRLFGIVTSFFEVSFDLDCRIFDSQKDTEY